MEITSKKYWDAVLCKLIETFISVKLWMLLLSSYFALKMLSIYGEMKETIFQISTNPNSSIPTTEILTILTSWSSKLLDVTLAMFTGVIVVITISREVFKHAKIDKNEKSDISDQIKNNMV